MIKHSKRLQKFGKKGNNNLSGEENNFKKFGENNNKENEELNNLNGHSPSSKSDKNEDIYGIIQTLTTTTVAYGSKNEEIVAAPIEQQTPPTSINNKGI